MRKTILIVDDDELTRSMLRFYCNRNDFDVVEAADGREALNIIDGNCPDLAIIDVQMPGIDGFDTVRQIRSKLDCQQLPIIFLTSRADINSDREGADSGAQGYLSKPFSLTELLKHIKALTAERPIQAPRPFTSPLAPQIQNPRIPAPPTAPLHIPPDTTHRP